MTVPLSHLNIKQELSNPLPRYTSQSFWDYEASLNDYHEDAATQTDSFTVFKPGPSIAQIFPERRISKLTPVVLESPRLRRGNHGYRNKSPNTVKVLMEKHRVNERLRHHCLNKQLYLICKIVPGFTEDGKETKVVMMQRIISYIAYLENTIRHLSSMLDVPPERDSTLLTDNIKDMDWSTLCDREFLHMNSEDSRDSEVSTMSISRRLKLSSPTIDSTTDCASQESLYASGSSILSSHTDCLSQAGSDVSPKTEHCEKLSGNEICSSAEWLMGVEKVETFPTSETFDTFFESSAYGQSDFQVPTSSYQEGLPTLETCGLDWLASPDKSVKGSNTGDFGIKIDSEFLEEPVNELSGAEIVSPDQVLPQTSIKRKRTESLSQNVLQENLGPCSQIKEDDCQAVPSFFKRKSFSPAKRHPFVDMLNTSLEVDVSNLNDHSREIPMASNFLEVESSSFEAEQTESMNEILLQIKEKVLSDASKSLSTSKVDLRKSSWLNGFMMYSRVHRKQFIKANRGVHTAQISKMMGQTWREMSPQEQHLYKDHARQCSLELQQVFDRKLTTSDPS